MEVFSKTAPLNVSDEALIQQFKEGSMDAFQVLYHRHLPAVFRRVRGLVPPEDAEDVVQEIFIAAFHSLRRFRGDAQFITWLRALASHKSAEYYRKRNRKQDPPLAPLSAASGYSEGSSTDSLEQSLVVQLAMQDLPERYREIILLRFIDDLPFNEIAQALGEKRLEAVKSLFRRAIVALKEHLAEEDLDDDHETNRKRRRKG